MTSLDRLHQAMTPGEDGRPPVLPSEAVKASLGRYGVSAAEQLLSARVGTEFNSSAKSAMDAITNPEIKALFEQDYATYQHIFKNGGITMPTPEELASGGIDWVHLAELKKSHPDHDLVVAPLTLSLEEVRRVVSGVTNDRSIPNNPLKKYTAPPSESDGLWVSEEVASHWGDIMTATAQEWQLPVVTPTTTAGANGIWQAPSSRIPSSDRYIIPGAYSGTVAATEPPRQWTAFLLPSSQESDRLGVSFRELRQQGIPTTSIVGHIAYQMWRITNEQPPVDESTLTWAQGQFRDSSGFACAPRLGWNSFRGRVGVYWGGAGDSFGNGGVRTPIA